MSRATVGKKEPYVWKVMFYGKAQPYDIHESFLGGTTLGAHKLEEVENYIVEFIKLNPSWRITRSTIQKIGIAKGKNVKQGFY